VAAVIIDSSIWVAQGERQVFAVLDRQRRQRDHRAGQGHALAVGQGRPLGHLDVGPVGAGRDHQQPHLAVVEQQARAGGEGGEQLRVRHAHPRPVAGRGIKVEPQPVAGGDLDPALSEGPQAEFRPLQVGQGGQRPLHLMLGGAHGLQGGGVILVSAMAEV
jgi:hypothetical protein